ncbi:HAMP domain-containing sensor histidine kinase [Actinoplanes sp. NPDC026619]|uniref:sensor histidine kinase n=1 Tax=Actinoplanes sp. NPDC026619 TaxID=3155798 RepID=UPI0033EB2D10
MRRRLRWRPRRWSHWTLRARLVLVVGALAAVALLVANIAGLVLIRTYLLGRIDDQLSGMARPFAENRAAGINVIPRNRFQRLGPEQLSYVYRADGSLDTARSYISDSARASVESFAEVQARAATAKPYTIGGLNSDWRVIAVPDSTSGGYGVIGVSLSEVQQTTDQLMLIDAGVTVLVLALLAGGAWFVVRLGLRPLTDMEELATDISAGNLGGRVAATDPHTEPGKLGLALNSMLARIETEVDARTASEQRLRQFVADASHELRTPLTSIRGFAELYRRGGAPPGAALDETMSRIESEAARMGVLVEDMLMLARLDRQRPPAVRPVDLLEIAADIIRDAHARVPSRPVKLAGLSDDTDTFEPATVLGDEHGLRQVATNLVANALQHTPARAQVTVRVGRLPARPPSTTTVLSGPATVRPGLPLAVFEVTDDGPGVPPLHAPRVFERLYRADTSRSRGKGGGSGLGLSIVAAIVHGHGGWVELDAPRGGGATFRVLLPTSGDAP